MPTLALMRQAHAAAAATMPHLRVKQHTGRNGKHNSISSSGNHLDELPLLEDAKKDIAKLEKLPPVRRLMVLLAYSARFTELGCAIAALSAWLGATKLARALTSSCAAAEITAVGRRVLVADHVVVYRYMADEYWAIGPENHWICRDASPQKPRPPEDVGRGMAGYVAQVGRDIYAPDVKDSPIYDPVVDDVLVCTHTCVHP
jgi:hypothetical protein